MWQKNDNIVIRNIINNRVLFAQAMKVIKDEYDEIILLCSPGNQYAGPESYFNKQFSNGAGCIPDFL